MKKNLFTTSLLAWVLCLLMPARVMAVQAVVDGIRYEFDTSAKTATVVQWSSTEYAGDIVIPSTVNYRENPYSVTSIGNSAFYGCSGLTSITIPEGVTSIGMSAFSRCSGLTSITIPESVTSIGSSAFSGCSCLTSIVVESGNSGYDSRDNCNAIIKTSTNELIVGCKNTVIPESVTSIGNSAFSGCSGLTSITIPEGVTSIGDYAFSGCTGLISITIPASVTSIGSSAFQSCSGLTSITIPASVTSIGSSAFSDCSSLTSITIPESVTSIGNNAFSYTPFYNNQPDGMVYVGNVAYKYKGTMPANTAISIREGTVGIASSAFSKCNALTSITIPESVTSIGGSAFYGCSGLTSITIPESVTSIGSSAFSGCSGLTSITISSRVTSIGKDAFSGCTGLISISIHGEVTSIGDWAFQSCNNLTAVHITDLAAWCNCNLETCNPLSLAHHLYLNGQEITDLVIPSTVSSINSHAFSYCTGLKSLIIEDGATTIGEMAFLYCTGLTSVTIPSSVTSIGNNAFAECTSLSKVTSFMVAPPIIDENTFPTTFKTQGTLYIPAGTRSIYSEKGWGQYFLNIVEMEEGEPIWLSIIDQEQGRTDMRCKAGQTYTFRFNAPEGRRIQSVTFRGADVTDWLTEDGEFTTPAMSKSAELIVTYDPSSAPAKGDVNGDGKITIADVTALVNVILGRGSANPAVIYDVERAEE